MAAGSLAMICSIPQVICGVMGGAVLDRFNRRTVSIISDVVSALCVMALPLVDMTVGLSFWWFALFGVLGAVGDIPGMTARDTLLPSVTAHDRIDLERYMGVSASVESLVTIAGPALAAGLVALGGDVSALWITGALSLLAALVTCGVPRKVGRPNASAEEGAELEGLTLPGLFRAGVQSLRDGLGILFKGDPMLRASVLLSLGVVGVMAGYQGIVLPAYFTEQGDSAMLGLVLSALSGGMLAGSLLYSAVGPRLSRRSWYVLSLVGMFAGMAVLGQLWSVGLILAGAFLCGFAAGPVSALLGFIVLDRIPAERRGAALGTQNTLCLLWGPLSVFAASCLIEVLSVHGGSLVLVVVWGAVTVFALGNRAMRQIDKTVNP